MKYTDIKKIACVGAGTIGSSWATNFAMKGYVVCVYDINEEQLNIARENVQKNLDLLQEKEVLSAQEVVDTKELVSYTTNLKEAVSDAQFIQESGPENYDIKNSVLTSVEEFTGEDTIIASSTSGLYITEIAKILKNPGRCVGGHPYNPPHLMPLVEVVKGEATDEEAFDCAYDFYKALGKEPVKLNKEVSGFISNRLQVALYREAIDLVMNGVCSVEDMDKAVVYGPGLRWGIMGPNLIFHLGAGDLGIRGLLTKLHDSTAMRLKEMARWTEEPAEWPEVAEAGVLLEAANRSGEQGRTIPEMISYRDDMLIEYLKLHKKL